ncbi:MAG: hypothetical protein U1E03_14700 [Hyphomonadaceae bacterium]
MLEQIISTIGLGYWFAIAAVFIAALIDKAGAARSPAEEPRRRGIGMALLALFSVVTPGVLVAYAYFITATQETGVRIVLIALPIVVVMAGAIAGALVGLRTRSARAMIRMTSIVTGLAALIVVGFVAWPMFQTGWAVEQTTRAINIAQAWMR